MRTGLEAIFFGKKERFLKFLYWKTFLWGGHTYCNNYVLMLLRLLNHIESFTLIVISVQANNDLTVNWFFMQLYPISETLNDLWEFQTRDVILHINHDLRIEYPLSTRFSQISAESIFEIFRLSQQIDCISVCLEEFIQVKRKYQVLYWARYLGVMLKGQSLDHSHFQGAFQVNVQFSFRNLVTNLC